MWIGRRELRLWGLLLVGIAFWGSIVRSGTPGEATIVARVVESIIGNGAFDVLAWLTAFALAARTPDETHATLREIIWTSVLGLAVLAPARLAAAVGAAGLAAMFLADSRRRAADRGIALVLLALACETFWLSALLQPLHVAAASVDAQICAAMLDLLGATAQAHGNIVDNDSAGFGIVIWPYCTATLQLASVGVAFVVMLLCRGRTPRSADLPWLAGAFAASIALTEVRLTLLAGSADRYEWWHGASGVSAYSMAALGLAILFPLLATREGRARLDEPHARTTA
ncbi:MAG TPA: hypothetical protein VHS58_21005 [Acetobacteraceae bacterium]|jgi:hypothetical protein|nr:hypothetical protein [Acetobacteraceae bacterium]